MMKQDFISQSFSVSSLPFAGLQHMQQCSVMQCCGTFHSLFFVTSFGPNEWCIQNGLLSVCVWGGVGAVGGGRTQGLWVLMSLLPSYDIFWSNWYRNWPFSEKLLIAQETVFIIIELTMYIKIIKFTKFFLFLAFSYNNKLLTGNSFFRVWKWNKK